MITPFMQRGIAHPTAKPGESSLEQMLRAQVPHAQLTVSPQLHDRLKRYCVDLKREAPEASRAINEQAWPALASLAAMILMALALSQAMSPARSRQDAPVAAAPADQPRMAFVLRPPRLTEPLTLSGPLAREADELVQSARHAAALFRAALPSRPRFDDHARQSSSSS